MTRKGTWRLAAAIGVATALTGAGALAAGNVVADRQAAMKQVAAGMKDGSGLASGQTAWDAAKAKAVMDGVAANARKLKGLYPRGSDTDPKTEALPAIWTNKADFDKRLTEMGNLAATAGKAKTADEFKTSFRALGGTCKGCHDLYRKKKS
jgi:cytochrome c556